MIVGYKKVGKTLLLERLIAEFTRRGYRVGCVKHHHSESPVIVDSPGTDTWRLRQAGAKRVALITPNHVASFEDTCESTPLQLILGRLTSADIVFGEGFHLEPFPKIEVLSNRGDRLCPVDQNLIAYVGPTKSAESVPIFASGSIKPLADFIEAKIFVKPPRLVAVKPRP